MKYIQATRQDANRIYNLVQDTIKTIYPLYYTKEVVAFFCEHHNIDNIISDIEKGRVSILIEEGKLIATGSHEDNHITRVFVDPIYQGKGYGSSVIQNLENEIALRYDTAWIEASLPASSLYEHRGYKTKKHEKMKVQNNKILAYEIMSKKLSFTKTQVNYCEKYFISKVNSENGEVNSETQFYYHQNQNMVWAEYEGGDIMKGNLIGTVQQNGELNFYYQHINMHGKMRIGKCHSIPLILENGKIQLKEEWQWLNGDKSNGSSILIEK